MVLVDVGSTPIRGMTAANRAYVVLFDAVAGGQVRVMQNKVRMTQLRHYVIAVAAPAPGLPPPQTRKTLNEKEKRKRPGYCTPYHINPYHINL